MKITRYPLISAALTAMGIATGMGIENVRQGDRVPREIIKEEAVQQDMRGLKYYTLVAGDKIRYAEILITEDPRSSSFDLSRQWQHARIKLTHDGKNLLDGLVEKYPDSKSFHIE